MTREARKKLAFIGNGAIAREIVRQLELNDTHAVAGALVLPEELDDPSPHPLFATIEELLELNASLIVECAGHSAVKDYAAPILRSGADLMIISIGALSDPSLYNLVKEEAEKSTSQVFLPAGALLGIDGLSAARLAGLDWVRLTSRKPPMSWSGAPGVAHLDLGSISSETVIFSGTARDAALQFPKNANVAATVALAGLGFEQTKVELIADPAAKVNSHVLEFEGRPGRYRIEAAGLASPDNPKTSMLTAYNIFRAIMNLDAAIVL